MENQNQSQTQKEKKSVGTILLIILLLIVTIASLILATYAWAKYSSVQTGDATAEVAKWDVKVNIKEGTNELEEEFEHVLAKKLAPGMSGSFEIDIDPGETEVDFHYDIILEKVEATQGTVPAHLHFYTSEGHGKDDLIGGITGSGDKGQSNGNKADNYLSGDVIVVDKTSGEKITPSPSPADGESFDFTDDGKIKKVIYWEWPYEDPSSPTTTPDNFSVSTPADATPTLTAGSNGISDYDDQDTIDGMNAATVKVKFRVITKQLNPKSTSYDG